MKDYIIFLIGIGIIPAFVFSMTWSAYITGSIFFFTLLIGGIVFAVNRLRKKTSEYNYEEKRQAV